MRDTGSDRMMAASLAGAAWGETGDRVSAANDTFRQAMRGVAATVNIVTICVDGRPMGMTATAMSSVSMDPPSLLVCINSCLTMHDPMEDVAHFCVNVLHGGQQELARMFADPARKESRFLDGWLMDGTRPPRLAEAQAAMLCRRIGHHRFGTHSIFIGEVDEVVLRPEARPLVYCNGAYGTTTH
jgi:flavin reductase (DIM6/NTAB) family NADH-FMN oxidoreductase RutF